MPDFDLGLSNGDNWGATQIDAMELAISLRGITSFTTAQRTALTGADLVAGRVVYDSTIGGLFRYSGSAWVQITPNVDAQLFSSSGTWTKPADVTAVSVFMLGGGGGGGSGARGPTGASFGLSGGSGGGAGERGVGLFRASDLSSTETVTVGTGGSGGAAVTTNATAGNAGGDGVASSFGSRLAARGGKAGGGGLVNTATNVSAGLPGSYVVTLNIVGSGGGGQTSPGGGGGAGYEGNMLAAGSGGGGGGMTTGGTGQAGGNGGGNGVSVGGASGAANVAGTAGPNVTTGIPLGGGGGGGGGYAAGGGAGGGYGGGGGGGGAAVDGTATGAGGAGSIGVVLVVSYR
jgi:hypothetical protein